MPTRQFPFFITKPRKKSLAAVLPHKKKMIGIRPTINTHDMHLKLENFMVALVHKEARGMDRSRLFIKAQRYALESDAVLPDNVFERILEKCQFTPVGSRLVYNEGCPTVSQIKVSSKGRLFQIAKNMDCIPKPAGVV